MRRSLLIAMALLALLGAGWAWRVRRGHGLQGPKVILMDPRPGEGLDPSEAQALGLFLKDHLELRGELSVSSLPTLPDPLPAQVPGSEVLVIQCDANRQGDLLGLDLHFARIPENPGARLGWTDVRIPPRPPAQAIQDGLAALPLRLAPFPPQALLPTAPPAFWDLLRATGGLMSNTSLEDAVMVGRRAVKEAPDCASVHFTVANLAYFQLLQDPLPFDAAEDLMDGAFRKGLAIVPDHPRGLRQYCRLKSDAGRQKDSLDLLKPALAHHPNSLELLWALDYSARSSGLLDIALAARLRMEALEAKTGLPPGLGYTFLYAGRLDRFEQSLWEYQNSIQNGLSYLERGYLMLIRKEPGKALEAFRRAERDPSAQKHVAQLAKAFRLQLEGHHPEALAALSELDRQRTGLRVPDGEFTFSMAEAAAYLGDQGQAMDLAHRSFSQGFGCTQWYERSPLLSSLQGLPRWKALLQHLHERQALMEARYSRRDFGL